MKKIRHTAAVLTAAVLCTALLSGCVTAEMPEDSAAKEITVAINSETGTLDPAGSIALTYLAYSVSALDELLGKAPDPAIVKEIITAHSQNINVISTQGAGSEFIFTLDKPRR